MIKLEAGAGEHIEHVSKKAVFLANDTKETVEFTFNGTIVRVSPGEEAGDVAERWAKDFETAAEAWRNSDEFKNRERKRAEEYAAKCAAVMIETATTELELRDVKEKWPYTQKQLTEYVESLVNRSHEYGTCVYALSLAAAAAFNYVSHKLGVTGFKASCADLDFLRRTRSINGPFILLKADDLLYPQYDLREKLDEAIKEWQPWLKTEAQKRLENDRPAAVLVVAHWQRLANGGK